MANSAGLQVARGGTGRCFEVDGAKVVQSIEKYPVGPFKAEYGSVKGRIDIVLQLSYLAVLDPGQDRLICLFRMERPSRWIGSRSEILTLTREFLYLHDVVEWLLGLEESILSALFNDHCDTNRIVKDREVIRVLLAIVDQLKPLRESLAADEEIRRKMLK